MDAFDIFNEFLRFFMRPKYIPAACLHGKVTKETNPMVACADYGRLDTNQEVMQMRYGTERVKPKIGSRIVRFGQNPIPGEY